MVKDIYSQSMKKWEKFDLRSVLPALRKCSEGALEDVYNVNGCRYYQWLPNLIDEIKPSQIVELGGAMGVSALMMLHTLPKESKLFSITLEEHGLEFSFIVDKYENFVPVIGNDLDLSVWPKDCDLSKTDLFFFDSLHTTDQLTKELALYSPFFKKGTILLFDDIRMDEIWPVWESLEKYGITDKHECTNPLHWSGFGLAMV